MFKNFKKVALSLLVVGLALGIQSFKNASKLNSITYYQLSEDSYDVAVPGGECDLAQPTTDLPCSIFYENAPSPTLPFSYENRPDPTNAEPSELETIYVEL